MLGTLDAVDVSVALAQALMSPYEIPDVLFRRPAWHAQAACRGMGTRMFFPGRTDDLDDARAVCSRCNVKTECLAAALESPETTGVWAGTSHQARRALLRRERA
jgi:WhiB family redox-sensing transcriptional regulator